MAKKVTPEKQDNYIYAKNATFRGDILENSSDEKMKKRRKERLEKGEGVKKKKKAIRVRKNTGRIILLVGFIALCGVIGIVGKSVVNLVSLESEKKQKQQELNALENEIAKDQDILQQVNSDEYIEQQARSELKMIKEGEVLYVVRDDGTKVPVDENGEPLEEEPED